MERRLSLRESSDQSTLLSRSERRQQAFRNKNGLTRLGGPCLPTISVCDPSPPVRHSRVSDRFSFLGGSNGGLVTHPFWHPAAL